MSEDPRAVTGQPPPAPAGADPSSRLLQRALLAVERAQAKLDAAEAARREPVAVIGLGCRLPGGASPAAFWRFLRVGGDAIRQVPAERWESAAAAGASPAPEPAGSGWGGFLDEVAGFDAHFFGLSPREAAATDPQQRLLLEVAWEALEAAGQAPGGLAHSRTGVFVGVMTNDYHLRRLRLAGLGGIDSFLAAGSEFSFVAGRLAYALGLQGPVMALNTACSSSLVAVHLACQSLRSGECDLALAGGVNLILSPEWQLASARIGALAADGRCRSFDAAAAGYARGEGCGVLVLKRLSQALAGRDPVLALIRGSAVNHGGPSGGLTVPSAGAQCKVIREALANAGVAPAEIDYVEAHGSGTPLGDPIEIEALEEALAEAAAPRPLVVGSVKTNLGHLEAAAGVAGLIKVVLALQHGEIPPHLHFERLNPHIACKRLALEIPRSLRPWPPDPSRRRRAGVSSFGLSGTNAHVVVEEAPSPPVQPAPDSPLEGSLTSAAAPAGRRWQLLVLSAKTAPALERAGANLGRHLAALLEAAGPPRSRPPSPSAPLPPAAETAVPLADVAYTLQVGRSELPHRLALVCHEPGEAVAELAAAVREDLPQPGAAAPADRPGILDRPHAAARREVPCRLLTHVARERDRPVMFLFPGLGEHYPGMGRGIYDSEPVFRAEVDRCAELLAPELGLDLRRVLYPEAPDGDQDAAAAPGPPDREGAGGTDRGASDGLRHLLGRADRAGADGAEEPSELGRTRLAQPAVFTVSYALARLWMSWGIRPRGLLGDSVGELVAACVSGVLDLAGALRLVARRAALVEALAPGAMLAVPLGMGEVEGLLAREGLAGELEVAIEGDDQLTVVGGPPAAIAELEAALARTGVVHRRVPARHAFHTRMMAGAASELVQLCAQMERRPPEIPYLSNLTGSWIGDEEAQEPAYWGRHLVGRVRLGRAMQTLLAEPGCILLEVGPGQSLGSLALRSPMAGAGDREGGRAAWLGAAAKPAERVVLASLRGRHGQGQLPHAPHAPDTPDIELLLQSLARLWLCGVPVEWEGFHAGAPRRRVILPTYPFERSRHWIDPPSGAGETTPAGEPAALLATGVGAAGAGGEISAPGKIGEIGAPGEIDALGGIDAVGAVGAASAVGAAGDPAQGNDGASRDISGWFHTPIWKQAPLLQGGHLPRLQPAGTCLLFLDGHGLGEHLAGLLRRAEQEVVTVSAGAAFASRGPEAPGGWSFILDPGRAEDYASLLARLDGAGLPPPRRVVHLWGVTGAAGANLPGPERLVEAQRLGFYSLLFLAQALGRRAQPALDFLVVSDGMQEVLGGELSRPEKATVLGPCRVLPLEHPGWSCRAVDVVLPGDPHDPGDPNNPDHGERLTGLAAKLAAELAPRAAAPAATGMGESGKTGGTGLARAVATEVLAIRGTQRWLQTYEKVPLDAPAPVLAPPSAFTPILTPPAPAGLALREGGVYLITGGLGGLGLAIALDLWRRCRARLVLLGRTPPPPRQEWEQLLAGDVRDANLSHRLQGLLALERMGAEVLTLTADVTDRAGLGEAVAAVQARFGTLDGVIHAAGAPGAGLIQLKTREMVEKVFSPKLRGTLLLAEAVAPLAPELFVLFSSSVALTGGLGEVDYCAANCFLGAFATHRLAAGRRTVAIEWGPWRWDSWQRELTSSVPWLHSWFEALRQRHGIDEEEGAEAFARATGAGLPRIAVLPQGLEETVATFTTELRERLDEGARRQRRRHGRPPLMNAYVAPGTGLERAVAEAWSEVLGIEQVGIHDHFFALGGNSLAGLEVVAHLGRRLGRDLPPAILFAGPTVASLARVLSEGGEEAAAVAAGGERGRRRREAREEGARPGSPE